MAAVVASCGDDSTWTGVQEEGDVAGKGNEYRGLTAHHPS